MDRELGADVEIAESCCSPRTWGKAMDHSIEGTHAQIGAEFAEVLRGEP